jgi:hypothetical protein
LGAQFLDAVDGAVSLILQAPDRWRIIEADVRRYSMPRFPYFIGSSSAFFDSGLVAYRACLSVAT